MGVERAVTRWYVQRQVLLGEIALLQGKLLPAETLHMAEESGDGDNEHRQEGRDVEDIEQELAQAQGKLLLLGPCPKPMMG